uniref:Uncharacterized protein n=1 Tax=Setaria digitata TaxID=48799 RepID=A0A915Q710_9BILA
MLTLFVVAASTVVSAKDRLPSCELIPKLLCCTERILDKCLIGCSNYVATKCPHKMKNYNKINSSTIGMHQNLGSISIFNQQATSISKSTPVTLFESRSIRRQPIKKPVILVESHSSQKLTELPKGHHITSGIPQFEASVCKTCRNYICLNQRYPIIEVSDRNHSLDSDVESSRPSYYSPRLSKNLVDELFLNCCQQHVVLPNSLCAYENREHIAVETLSETIQQNFCSLKYFSRIFCTVLMVTEIIETVASFSG